MPRFTTGVPHRARRLRWAIVPGVLLCVLALAPLPLYAQEPTVGGALGEGGALNAPTFWYLLAAGLALLVPAGFVLIGVAGLDDSVGTCIDEGGAGLEVIVVAVGVYKKWVDAEEIAGAVGDGNCIVLWPGR